MMTAREARLKSKGKLALKKAQEEADQRAAEEVLNKKAESILPAVMASIEEEIEIAVSKGETGLNFFPAEPNTVTFRTLGMAAKTLEILGYNTGVYPNDESYRESGSWLFISWVTC